jgi:hypothetical protein
MLCSTLALLLATTVVAASMAACAICVTLTALPLPPLPAAAATACFNASRTSARGLLPPLLLLLGGPCAAVPFAAAAPPAAAPAPAAPAPAWAVAAAAKPSPSFRPAVCCSYCSFFSSARSSASSSCASCATMPTSSFVFCCSTAFRAWEVAFRRAAASAVAFRASRIALPSWPACRGGQEGKRGVRPTVPELDLQGAELPVDAPAAPPHACKAQQPPRPCF